MLATKQSASLHDLFSRRTVPLSLENLLKPNKSVMIYGAGNCGKDVQRVLLGHGVSIEGFLDTKMPHGTSIQGTPVFHPDDKDIGPAQRAQVQVIIAIFNRETSIVSIQEFLRKLGYEHLTTFLEFHRCCADELGDRFWLTSPSFYDSRMQDIMNGLDVWHEEKSRSLYTSMLKMRRDADCSCALPLTTEGIYFDDEFPRWKTPMRFIDCGSFDGDTLIALKKAYGTVQSIAAYEPDLNNFSKLCSLLKSDGTFAEKAVLYPCGVWSHTTQLNFTSESAESSHLSSGGSHRVQCVSLDETLHGFDPTLIKMDIEGAEPEALEGAIDTIRKSRPGLAISVYHRPDHLWKIPLLVKQWDIDYKLYLRIYGYSGFDAVLYALPQ